MQRGDLMKRLSAPETLLVVAMLSACATWPLGQMPDGKPGIDLVSIDSSLVERSEASNSAAFALRWPTGVTRYASDELVVQMQPGGSIDPVSAFLNATVTFRTGDTYALRVVTSDSDDLTPLPTLASELGSPVPVAFSSRRSASLFLKSLEVRKRFPDEVRQVALNTLNDAIDMHVSD